jgi:hypothetical protein
VLVMRRTEMRDLLKTMCLSGHHAGESEHQLIDLRVDR